MGKRDGCSRGWQAGDQLRAAVAGSIPTIELQLARDVHLPAHEANEALIQIEACGVCGTDLHILSGTSYRPDTPFVLGHEPVGLLTTDVDGGTIAAGQRVTMTIFEGCGRCSFCTAGDERLCPQLRSIVGVYRRWGGFADCLAVPSAQLVPVPPQLSAVVAASLVDAGATAANAARVVDHLKPTRPIVLGGGPVGLLTAELLRYAGASPTVVEPSHPRRRELERRSFSAASSIEDLFGQTGIDCVIDCAGVAALINDSIKLLEPHGSLVIVGYTKADVDFSYIARKELRVMGIRSGNREDLVRILSLVDTGAIAPPPTNVFGLSDINTALGALRAGELAGKAVITPQA
jgi:(R,R)-butanediol dehydrogenase/meso-butanediol dehydrogenase/diacetyl reductase